MNKIPLPDDLEIKEVILAAQMLKAFKAGYDFAQERFNRLTPSAKEKALAYLCALEESSLSKLQQQCQSRENADPLWAANPQ